jgi:hypothetical protein
MGGRRRQTGEGVDGRGAVASNGGRPRTGGVCLNFCLQTTALFLFSQVCLFCFCSKAAKTSRSSKGANIQTDYVSRIGAVRHFFCPTRSVFERVGLPAVQGKCSTYLYVTCSTEACTAGCTTVLYGRGNGPLAELIRKRGRENYGTISLNSRNLA